MITDCLIQFLNYADIKSFFGTTSSRNSATDSNSGPSTHESGTAAAQSEELEAPHPLQAQAVQETVEGAANEEQPSHEHDVECINIFTLDVHLVSNMGLRVAIDIEGRYVQMSFTLFTYLDQYHFLIDLSIKLTDLFTIILI